jgi:hypothetical protein
LLRIGKKNYRLKKLAITIAIRPCQRTKRTSSNLLARQV